ncbi:MAG: S-layer homology domain-containing protein, partial [Evtepia sp.]
RLLSLLCLLSLCITISVPAIQADDTAAWLLKTTPQVSSIGGEWSVFALARGEYAVPNHYNLDYIQTLETYIANHAGQLSARKYTEYARVVLALTALGRDPTQVAGYNLLLPLADYDKVTAQGVNGAAFALLALGNYPSITSAPNCPALCSRYLDYLKKSELPGGGFSLAGAVDPDITAMVLSALARYKDQTEIKAIIDRALALLSTMQGADGGFQTQGVSSCESVAQVIVALCELNIPMNDPRFVKNGVTLQDALSRYALSDGSFSHDHSQTANHMATEQAMCALAALKRMEYAQSSLYDMDEKLFPDTQGHPNETAIRILASKGIINGMGNGLFMPDETMSRAEFSALISRALALPMTDHCRFSDVPKDAWYANYVEAAANVAIIHGIGGNCFNPNGTITLSEADIMLARAAQLKQLNRDIPAWIPSPAITRAQVAARLFDLLSELGVLQ